LSDFTVTKNEMEVEENQNENITTFSGRPNLKAIVDSIQRKERLIKVSPNYLVDLVQQWETGTSYSYQMFHDAPKKLREMDELVQTTQHENAHLKEKLRDLVVELTVTQESLDKLNEKEQDYLFREQESRIIQLSVKKINTFLSLCHPQELTDMNTVFYIKIDKDGEMQRMVRKREEL
jgi:hypothetical protein